MSCEIDYQDYQDAIRFDQRIAKATALQSLTLALIDELDPQENDRVLDVGTGTGRLGVALHNMIPNGYVTGIDSGYGMLKVANDKILDCQADNFFLVRGKAEALPFSSESFNSSCFMLSFHHFTEPEKAVEEIHRILKTKGYLVSLDPVLQEATDEEDERLNKLIEEAFQMAHGPEFRFFTASELRSLYERASFSIETYEIYDFPFHQKGMDGIPMGPHWFQAYDLLWSEQEKNLIERFEQNYFTFREQENQLLVKGKMSWATIKAVKV